MPRFRVIASLGGCIYENSVYLEIYLTHPCRIFKDHMYLDTRNQALLHENNKGADQPMHWQSYQHLCFKKVYMKK